MSKYLVVGRKTVLLGEETLVILGVSEVLFGTGDEKKEEQMVKKQWRNWVAENREMLRKRKINGILIIRITEELTGI